MKLSTKGRYAVHALVDIAHTRELDDVCNGIKPVSLSDISLRHDISQAYLEQLFVKLRRAGLVESVRGSNGGYYLSKASHDISIADIIDAVDEPLKTTKCDPLSKVSCQGKSSKCLTHNLWSHMETTIQTYLADISLADVVKGAPHD